MGGWRIWLAYWWKRLWWPRAHRLPLAQQPAVFHRYRARFQVPAAPTAPPPAPPPAVPTAVPTAVPRVPKQARPRAIEAPTEPPAPPEEQTIDSKHVSVAVLRTGLVIRRRAGYTGWLPICDLKWADIQALELDSGTHDAARMLYVSVRSSPMRKPLIDQAHLTTDQWFLLRESVAAWTEQSVLINLAHLRVTERARPYDEL